jgi:hypothetical protein
MYNRDIKRSILMRIAVLIVLMFTLSACTAMLVGGSAASEQQNDCTETEQEAEKRGC